MSLFFFFMSNHQIVGKKKKKRLDRTHSLESHLQEQGFNLCVKLLSSLAVEDPSPSAGSACVFRMHLGYTQHDTVRVQ